ncbi:MAG: ROK family protein [Nocardioidaceae bacterium]|nr:ROK family protein [Nocardioidaceae bacterium]
MLAVDVGGTTVKAEVVDGCGRVLTSGATPTPSGPAALESVSRLGRGLLEQVGAQRPVARAGLVLPGIVDRVRRIGVRSANVGWSDLSFGPELEASWRIPVLVDHDVTLAGWAEWRTGAGRGADDVVFVVLGTGISAALVVDGRLVRGGGGGGGPSGSGGQAGELGHVVVRADGPRCGCGGRGCLEAVASGSAIAREYARLAGREVDGAHDVLLALDDDPIARRVWDDAVAALADGVSAVVALLAPSRIVFGGGLAEAGEALIGPLRKALGERVFVTPAPDLLPAHHGARAGLVGAALLARLGGTDGG